MVRFVFVIFLQGLILNNVELFGYVTPYVYPLFILLLPLETNPVLVLGFSFALGFFVDMFSLTWGMHTSSAVFLAFLRPYILRLLSPRDGYLFGVNPDLSNMGVSWFVSYASICLLSHHLFLFYVEVFQFEEFFFTFWRALLSSVFSLVLIILLQMISYRQVRSS